MIHTGSNVGPLKKVLVIGSGPIVIGQAAEFDYAGTQACMSLREEGIKTVLVNSNPATIMTDKETADSVYIEPLTVGTNEPGPSLVMNCDGLTGVVVIDVIPPQFQPVVQFP